MIIPRLTLAIATAWAVMLLPGLAHHTDQATAEEKAKKESLHGAANKSGHWSRVVIQPNGWGRTPQSATKDLDRVMRIYEDQPGFRRDKYVAVVKVGRNMYQADGRCSYLVPKKPQAQRKKARNSNVAAGGFARKGGSTNASSR